MRVSGNTQGTYRDFAGINSFTGFSKIDYLRAVKSFSNPLKKGIAGRSGVKNFLKSSLCSSLQAYMGCEALPQRFLKNRLRTIFILVLDTLP
jgi:hypothetical protein